MCFSASASFSLTAVLLPAGAYCTRTALRRDRSLIPMAVIPILFGGQQFAEGLVWLGIHHDQPRLVAASSLIFLFFALCWWLFWIPFTVLVITRRRRPVRWFIRGTMLAGLAGGLMLYAPLVLNPAALTTRIVDHSIQYRFAPLAPLSLLPVWVLPAVYLAIVAAPLLASRSRPLLGFAVVLILMAVVSEIVYWYCFVSVWCFFAAVLSFQLCFLFGNSRVLSAVTQGPPLESIDETPRSANMSD